MRITRLDLMREISDITDYYCTGCPDRGKTSKVCNVSCPQGKRLLQIGNELKSLLNQKRIRRRESKMARPIRNDITEKIVKKMLAEGKTKAEIAAHFKIETSTLSYHIKKWDTAANEKPVTKKPVVKEQTKNNKLIGPDIITAKQEKEVKDYEALKKEYRLLEFSNKQLTEAFKEKEVEVKSLNETLEETMKTLESLKSEFKLIEQSNVELRNEIQDKDKESHLLKQQVKDITEEYNREVIKQQEEVQSNNKQSYLNQINLLEEKLESLSAELNDKIIKLKNYEALKAELSGYEELNQDLKNQRDIFKMALKISL